MPVGCRDNCFAGTQRIGKRPGNHLGLMAVGSDIDIRRADELYHLLWTDEAVVEGDAGLHADFLSQSLQSLSIAVSFTPQNMRMGRTRNYVNNVFVLRQNLWQRLNHTFNSFIG